VGAIVGLFKRVRAYEGYMAVVGVHDQPLAILRLLRLDRVLARPSS
jgi:anti-sigma B factor antagonist